MENLKRLILFIITLFGGLIVSAQSLPGDGSAKDPYRIENQEHWDLFAKDVAGGYDYSDKIVQLINDIGSYDNPITTMIGEWNEVESKRRPFSGKFYGDNKTLTINLTSKGSYTAPFVCTKGAEINKLHVAGVIDALEGYSAGVVGIAYGTKATKINGKHTVVSVEIDGGGSYCAGVAVDGTKVEISSCIFNGIIYAGNNSAGFCAISSNSTKINECLFAPILGSVIEGGENFANGGLNTNSKDFYYTYQVGTSTQGIHVYTNHSNVPADKFTLKQQLYDDNYYYVEGTGAIIGLHSPYYNSNAQHGGVVFDVTFDGTVIGDECYTTTVLDDHNKPVVISEIGVGTFTLKVEGKVAYCTGVLTAEFEVVKDVFANGSGTAGDPYQIGNEKEWDKLADAINKGHSFVGEYLKLTGDIKVSTMVGASGKPFMGTFTGDLDKVPTLTFNMGTNDTPFNEEICAPFRYIDGATIQNLNVAGTITTNQRRAAGLIGVSSGTSTVQDVTVSTNIYASRQYYCAGFAVEVAKNSTLDFTRCIYDGILDAGYNCAGFCASGNGTTNINNCLFKPIEKTAVSSGQNFTRSSKQNITEGYYTYKIGTSTQGYQAYVKVGLINFLRKMQLLDGKDYFVDGKAEIVGVNDVYMYTGQPIDVSFSVKFFGEVIDDINYRVIYSLNGVTQSEIVDRGDYNLIVRGENLMGYYGSVSTMFAVVPGPLNNGSGTAADPYLITSADDWDIVSERVNHGMDNTKCYKLDNNITVSTMIGANGSDFEGVFDGNWKIITFNKGTAESPFNEDYCAPFRYVEDAKIMNLTVDGTIISSKKYVGGVIGYASADDGATIENCTSSVDINCTYISGDCYYGGFVGRMSSSSSGYFRFRNCLFNGSIVDNKATKDAENCSGFIGYVTVPGIDYTRDMIYVNCCVDGTISVKGKTANFHRGSTIPTLIYHTYYVKDNTDDEAVQGEAAPTTATANYISKKQTVGNVDYYVPGAVVLGLETDATGTAPAMACYGSKMVKGTDYSVTGNNPYTISGVNENGFYGSVTTTIVDNWTALNAALKSNGIVDLVDDVTAASTDATLLVSGGVTVTLNLNGHTVDRHLSAAANLGHVFRILSGNKLTINGNGTVKGGFNKATGGEYDGGGFYNLGNLTLNSVYISNNHCVKKSGVDASARGGAVYSGGGSSLTMTGCYVAENTSQGGGGGVYGQDASVFVLDDDYFYSNTSESKGGGIRVRTKSSVTARITNCDFVYNTVTAPAVSQAAQGGGVYMEDGNLYMENNEFTGNFSNLQGSGLYQSKGTITAKNCNFSLNGSYQDNMNSSGAGAYLYSGTFIMDGGSVTENMGYTGTGGIHINKGAKLKLKGKVEISNNIIYAGMSPVTRNVYIGDPSANGVIEILEGFDNKSNIGVLKNFSSGFIGVFTKNLYANGGTVANFVTDDDSFNIGPNAEPPTEAQFAAPKAWDQCVNGVDYNKTGDSEPYSYEILKPVSVVEGDVVANTISFSGAGCLYISDNSTLTAEIINNGDPVRLVIEDGGQVITTSEYVEATVKKNTTKEKWYLISSAIDNPYIEDNTNVITTDVPTNDPPTTYDLFRFNEAAAENGQGEILQWENYRANHSDFTLLQNGRGYLYRHAVVLGHTIMMEGTLNVGDKVGSTEERVVNYQLSCDGTNALKGFHIIGNPYSHNITKGNSDANILNGDLLEEKYYVLEERIVEDEVLLDWWLTEDGTNIPPLTGVLVQAKKAGTMAITKRVLESNAAKGGAEGEKKEKNANIWFSVANSSYKDIACVEFKEGHGLNKVDRMNADAPMLYIRHNGEDFASADLGVGAKRFNLNFEAKTTGIYTLSYETGSKFLYLHLIDKVAGKDIDLLQDGAYSFMASPADERDRFEVRLKVFCDNGDEDVFAYQSGDEIVLSGEGELQIFDLTGRLVATHRVTGVETIEKPSAGGVYILRLNEKTQKIVVR